MTENNSRLTRMEIFSGSLVIFVGLFYLMLFVGPLFQNKVAVPFKVFTLQQGKMMLYILLYVSGGLLLFRSKYPGWIICTASLLNLVCVTTFTNYSLLEYGLNRYQIIPFLFLILGLMALLFMFNKKVRINQRVTNKQYLFTLIAYFVLLTITVRL